MSHHQLDLKTTLNTQTNPALSSDACFQQFLVVILMYSVHLNEDSVT